MTMAMVLAEMLHDVTHFVRDIAVIAFGISLGMAMGSFFDDWKREYDHRRYEEKRAAEHAAEQQRQRRKD